MNTAPLPTVPVPTADEAVAYKIPWQERARCRQPDVDPNIFISSDSKLRNQAIRTCGQCVVRIECLNYALRNGEKRWVYGGMTASGRRQLLKMPA